MTKRKKGKKPLPPEPLQIVGDPTAITFFEELVAKRPHHRWRTPTEAAFALCAPVVRVAALERSGMSRKDAKKQTADELGITVRTVERSLARFGLTRKR